MATKLQAFTNTAAANTAVVVTVTAYPTSSPRNVKYVAWSLDATPATAIALTFASNSVTLFQIDITTGGPGFFEFPSDGIPGANGNTIVVTLAAAGASIIGKLNVLADKG